MSSLAFFLRAATAHLAAAGVDTPELDTRLLVAAGLGCDRLQLLTERERVLTADELKRLNLLIDRRVQREPVARILGLREFWGLPFGLNEATLEPRPDSETLIEVALGCPKSATILDLGTGTGCLLLALLHEWPEAIGVGTDIAPRAVEQAQANAARLGLEQRATFRVSDWLDSLSERFDLIVSNPPYIPSRDIPGLMPEVREHDPMQALDGGADGLAPYRYLIPRLPHHLTPQGHVIFEVGQGQADEVAELLRRAGFIEVRSAKDLGGVERCVAGRLTS